MAQQEITLKVEGMTCSNCAMGIEKALRAKGFSNAAASFMEGEVSFSLESENSTQKAINEIEALGYEVRSSDLSIRKGLSDIEKKFLYSLVFTIPLFMHMFVAHTSLLNNPYIQLGLCLPVYILGVSHFGRSALGSLKARLANMDVLIFTGSTAAFIYSISGMIIHGSSHEVHNFLFFETTAMIITLVLLGNVLENRSVQQASGYLSALMALEPQIARIVIRVGSREKILDVEPAVLKQGDFIQVNEGDRIPADGQVAEGNALIDESAITGESEPVNKQEGDYVYSGTVVISGSFRANITATAKHSTLQRITELVKKARRDQPEIQRLGDRVSAIFVPVVLVIAGLTFALNYTLVDAGLTKSLLNSIAVLVIACPCAMGLATPTAVAAGVGRAAKDGVIFKGGNTVERLANASMMVFDKTGTLTTGQFTARFEKNETGERSKAIIKALEAHSSHPIATSLVKLWPEVDAERITAATEEKGSGMRAILETGEEVWFGKSSDQYGETDLMLTVNGEVKATLYIEDELKPGVERMVTTLKASGLRLAILSGDKLHKVKTVADVLGIEEYYAGVSPAGKLEMLEKWSAGGNIAMMGDGINDGPALSRAQTGIAPGSSTALAQESARVVIMHPDEMEGLIRAYKTAVVTYTTIKQNLFWAFFYNVVAIPVAAAGFLNPMVAALAMAFSDVVVIGNSIRLKYRKIE